MSENYEEEYGMSQASAAESTTPMKMKQKGPPPTDMPITVEPINRNDLQPSYANELEAPSNGLYGSFITGLGECFGLLGAIPCCICVPNPFQHVDQGSVGLVTRFGQFYKSVDPGLVKVNLFSEKMHQVEVRIQVLDIPQQTCMTKDNVNVKLSSVMYYHIQSPHKARFGVSNVFQALQERTQTTLRHVVGARVLQEIIERREEVAGAIEEIINDTATSWGVKVESILIKDVLLSDELQDSFAQAAKARRAGESKVITAEAEIKSAKLMRRAADILASPAALQIRYLEAMQNMAKNSGSKVIFMPSQGALENLAVRNGNNPEVQAETTGNNDHGMGEGSSQQQMIQNAAYQQLNI